MATNTQHSPSTSVSLELQRDVEQFLYEEARLLDTWEFRAWLKLLAPDLHYWAPVRENRLYRERKKEQAEPGTSAYFDDTYDEIVQRVERLYTHMAWAEEPPSRTRHLVTNIQVRPTDDPDELAVDSAFYLHRTRTERDADWIVGGRQDVIRRTAPGSEHPFQIARRTIIFDMSTLLIKNLSSFY
ncbi:3-phenylpropionate/cinnamic acid dioxygenase subunit beta [Aeromicrobium wangtongii]|uniref:3-phenylpropionate/cinnamic acid dioxygenase subunit beta n=1 Tax=Aeromicrobium wangtongii TaxID=2969247 RepID=UPI002016CE54|nr:3-phenylpropionate/cinnamic acid dioxygenase subunit beta [Aeromicrobium wangtongii]MCL3819411.1 3-phenylpropionate/cinnamic acid dioxygenase subunit beta [Aeromicrobium wangtongii]